jgi:endonuclease/exonuclease/phosphatase family metal-dependent hydrolase
MRFRSVVIAATGFGLLGLMLALTPGRTAAAVAPGGPSDSVRADETVNSDSILIAQYNVQFLFPSWVPGFVFDVFDHFPDNTLRASLIGEKMACKDIVSFNETSNDDRRADIFASMEANAAACGRAPLIDGGTRFWDFFVGPHGSQTDPVVDDEIAIASRFPIIQVHTLAYSSCSGENCLAEKGALHVRVWRGPGHHGRDALDVFTTHTNDKDTEVQLSQVEELKAFIQARHDPTLPVIIMGDFNIVGNPEDLENPEAAYYTMMAKLSEPVPGLEDKGIGTQGTNVGMTNRIDYVFVAGLPTDPVTVDYFVNQFSDISDPDLPTDGRLSDHGAVLTTGQWEVPYFPPNPPITLPRDVRVEVSRLQEITLDVPTVLPAIVPVIIPSPIGPITLSFPVNAIACDGLTDHFGNLQLIAGSIAASSNFDEDHTFEGDDITPEGWETAGTIAPGVTTGVVSFALFDEDDLVCGGGNDEQDINPFSDDFSIALGLNFDADGIFFGSTRLSNIGEPFFLTGTDEENRARATLFIETRYSSTADSDSDGLTDAEEAYTYRTNPEDSDTDDDQLTDGDEVLNYGTNPLDADSDDDELMDGVEVQASTDPLDADTDNDGLKDGEDVEFIENVVSGLPLTAFRTAAVRAALITRLEAIENQLAQGHKADAITEITQVRVRVDGCGAVAESNDWITDCASQVLVRALLDLLAANLAT